MADLNDLIDPYEVRIGIPTASWKYARIGDGFEGIIYPQNGKPYILQQQVSIAGDPLWWSRGDDRIPRVQQDILLGQCRDIKTNDFVDASAWMSNKAIERYATAKAAGDASAMEIISRVERFRLRRQIIKGESLSTGMLNAVRLLSDTLGPKPVVGAILTFTLVKLVPNEHQGETKVYEVKYRGPSDASKRLVDEYVSEVSSAPEPAGDPYGSPLPPGEPPQDEEPPF